jgi:hypothetical protein
MYCLHIQQEQECTGLTEITFVITMEDNDDWLANNRTWKKWTGLGEGGCYHMQELIFINQKMKNNC